MPGHLFFVASGATARIVGLSAIGERWGNTTGPTACRLSRQRVGFHHTPWTRIALLFSRL